MPFVLSSVQFSDVVDLVRAIAWPLVLAVAIIVLRRPIGELVKEIGRRTTKISALQVSIELAAVPEFKPKWSSEIMDVRKPTPSAFFLSDSKELVNQISARSAADYSVIDLGEGEEWLTSRLFIFAVLLERMRGLRCLVFVETVLGQRRQFIGMAAPSDAAHALAGRYPWLKSALEKALATPLAAQVTPDLLSARGGLEVSTAVQILADYLGALQRERPDTNETEWVRLEGEQLSENAKWLTGARLERVLSGVLEGSWIADTPDEPAERSVASVVRSEGQFVAALDHGRRFQRLIDRNAVLEQVAMRATESDHA